MADIPPITRILIETIGAHEHVSVWFGGKLSGTLVVDAGQGDELKSLLVAGKLGLPTMEDVMAMAREREASWLVKDFNVLYRVADEATAAMAVEGYIAHDLATQLARLKPVYELTESVREAARTGPPEPHKSWTERGLDLLGKLSGKRDDVRPATDADWRDFVQRGANAQAAADAIIAGHEATKKAGEGD